MSHFWIHSKDCFGQDVKPQAEKPMKRLKKNVEKKNSWMKSRGNCKKEKEKGIIVIEEKNGRQNRDE